MKLIIKRAVDGLHDTEWWDAAIASKDAPASLRPLLDGDADSVTVDADHDETIMINGRERTASSAIRQINEWAASLPGWEAKIDPQKGSAHRPLVFEVAS